jgi:hypothetical protein
MKKLPADFPKPPADRESLAAAVAWMFQVLSWLIARAAAGDKWWIGLEETQPDAAEPAAASSERPEPEGRQATERRPGADPASWSAVRPGRPKLPLPEAEGPKGPEWTYPLPRQAEPLPSRLHRSHRSHRPALSATIQRPSRRAAAGCRWPTTGPPQISRAAATASSHALFVTISKQNTCKRRALARCSTLRYTAALHVGTPGGRRLSCFLERTNGRFHHDRGRGARACR